MRKLLALTLALILMLGLVGCGKKQFVDNPSLGNIQETQANTDVLDEVSNIPLVTVVSDADEVPVYVELYYEKGNFHNIPFNERLNEVNSQIPVVTYQEGMSIEFSDKFECWGIEVYDIGGEHIVGLGDLSALSNVNSGEYYFSIYIVEKHANETREFNGYNCVFRMMIPALDPLVTVVSNGEETVAPKYWYCSMSWEESDNGSGWLFADGMGIYDELKENLTKLPEVYMDKDVSLQYGENITHQSGFDIYDENFEKINRMETLEELKDLKCGTYYVLMNVFRNGTEMHEGEMGYDGYHCGFKLIVP